MLCILEICTNVCGDSALNYINSNDTQNKEILNIFIQELIF